MPRLVAALNDEGIDAVLAAANAEGKCFLALKTLTVPGEILTSESRAALAREISNADLVEIHSLWNGTSSAAARLCRHAGVPYILTPRGMLDPACLENRAISKRLYRFLVDGANIRKAAGFHFLSTDERDRAVTGRLLSEHEIAVSPNGAMQIPEGVPAGVLRELFPAVNGRPVLLHLGRLDQIKRVELQIRALARIPKTTRPVLLLVGPDYGARRSLERLAQDLHVESSVIFGGSLDGVQRFGLLAEADLVLLTSVYDCNPVVATETLMMGGAMLATEGCGLAAVGQAGAVKLVSSNATDVAGEIRFLLQNPEALITLRKRAKEYAQRALSWSMVVRPLVDLYERLLQPVPSGVPWQPANSSPVSSKS